MRTKEAEKFTAVELLHAFLEMHRLYPAVGDWTEATFTHESSGLARLRQLMALFRAFRIPWDPQGFLEGDFMRGVNLRYGGIVAKLQSEMESAKIRMPVQMRGDLALQLPDFFQQLLKYRSRFEIALSHNESVGEASGLYLLAYQKIHQMNQLIQSDFFVLDQTLGALISPEGGEFTKAEMISLHGYPDVNVRALDADEW